jgi:serine/threonine protein kinase
MSEPHIRPNLPDAEGSTLAIGTAPRPAGQIEIAAPLEEGSRIGPYEVREHIGDGGMAAVYKVWHTGLHRFEALKIPRYQASRGPEADFLHRLLAEARTAAGLQHPHIVAIHNVSDEKSILHYFAMEFVDGSDLAAIIGKGPLPFEETLTILRQIGSALDYAHAHNVVHRDVKPANILLENTTKGWHARVVDFGISRAGEDDGNTRLTRSGMIVGTPEYMSPEQSGSGAAVDYRTDIYSLGVVAYEMLCGHPPFVAGDGVSRISVLMKQINEPPLPLDQYRPDLPPAASRAVLKALAKNPEERFTSCAQFLEALAAAPPQEEFAQLPSGKTRRPTMANVLGTPTLSPTPAGRSTEIGEAPNPPLLAPERVPVVTRRTALAVGVVGLIAGAFMLLNMRSKPETTVAPEPTVAPIKVAPITPQPTSAPINTRPTPRSIKAVVQPAPKPTAKKPTVQVKTAKPLHKPTPRLAPRRRVTTRTRTVPQHSTRRTSMHRSIIKSSVRRTRPTSTYRSAPRRIHSGNDAPLPP